MSFTMEPSPPDVEILRPSPGSSYSFSSSSSSSNPAGRDVGVLEYRKGTKQTSILQYFITPLPHFRGQPVRRSFRFMLKVGLASEARSTKACAKAEGRRRGRVRVVSRVVSNRYFRRLLTIN
jgi:hypothetical protein